MERLKVQQVEEIVHRLREGQSERSIVRDLGCARETLRRYASIARESGFLSEEAEMPSLSDIAAATTGSASVRRSNVSSVEPYRSDVKELVKNNTEAHGDSMVASQDTTATQGSYSSRFGDSSARLCSARRRMRWCVWRCSPASRRR